jgi:hypothetical protein
VESGHPSAAKNQPFSGGRPATATVVGAAQANYQAAFVLVPDGNNIEAAFAAATEQCAGWWATRQDQSLGAWLRLQLAFEFVEKAPIGVLGDDPTLSASATKQKGYETPAAILILWHRSLCRCLTRTHPAPEPDCYHANWASAPIFQNMWNASGSMSRFRAASM